MWLSLGYIFWLKIPKKHPKNAKNWFFSHVGQTMCPTIIKFCIDGLDLNMYLHEKFHWPVINRFLKIQLWIFSKFCIYTFEKHFKFLQPRKCVYDPHIENLFFINILTWVQNFTMVQKLKKPKITAQSHDIRGTNFCIFGHLKIFRLATAKRIRLVAPNFAYSLPSSRTIFMQNFSQKSNTK